MGLHWYLFPWNYPYCDSPWYIKSLSKVARWKQNYSGHLLWSSSYFIHSSHYLLTYRGTRPHHYSDALHSFHNQLGNRVFRSVRSWKQVNSILLI